MRLSGKFAMAGAVVAAALTGGAWLPGPALAAARAPAAAVTEEFGYVGPGVSQWATAPAGATGVEVHVIGARGGSTANDFARSPGGEGAEVSGMWPAVPGELFQVLVGGRGGDGGRYTPGTGGWGASGGGGNGGRRSMDIAGNGAGGGGSSRLDVWATGESVLAAGGGPGGNASGGGGGGGASGGRGGGGGGSGGSAYPVTLMSPSVTRGTTSDGNGRVIIIWITKPVASLRLTASATEVLEGQSPVFTVHLPADATGSVGFYNLTLPGPDQGIGVAPIIDGVATLTAPTRPLLLGRNAIRATYGGDSTYGESNSNTVTVTVVKLVPSIRLTASPTTVREGQSPVFTVQLPADATGRVAFYNLTAGNAYIGEAVVVHGIATLTATTRPLPLGQDTIEAIYGGDHQYAEAKSNPVTVTVRPA